MNDPTPIQQQARALQGRIYSEQYYVKLWEASLALLFMTPDALVTFFYTDAELIDLCNEFWSALPDSPVIRRGPFWDLCNIAENIFK